MLSRSLMLLFQTVHHNAYHNDPYAQEFGIRIDKRLATVEARVLPAPWVCNLLFYFLFLFDTILVVCDVHAFCRD